MSLPYSYCNKVRNNRGRRYVGQSRHRRSYSFERDRKPLSLDDGNSINFNNATALNSSYVKPEKEDFINSSKYFFYILGFVFIILWVYLLITQL